MKRLAICAAAAATMAMGAAAPAKADFHSLCAAPANSLPSLTTGPTPGSLAFSATVNCGGADWMLTSTLNYQRHDGFSGFVLGQTCGPCDTLSLGGTIADAGPGIYTVSYGFMVVNNGLEAHATRSARWLWLGLGQPIQICRRDAPPNPAGC